MHEPNPSKLNSSVILWGRCEGWVKLGRHHAVVIDVGKGEARDEKGKVLAQWDGVGWRVPGEKFESWRFDQLAVTHVPLDPHHMSQPDWLERMERRREKVREMNAKRAGERKIARKSEDGGRDDRGLTSEPELGI